MKMISNSSHNKTTRNTKKKNEHNEPDSYDLFGSSLVMEYDPFDHIIQNKKENTCFEYKKQNRTQDAFQKSDCSSHGTEKNKSDSSKSSGRHKSNENISIENRSFVNKHGSGQKPSTTTRTIDEKNRRDENFHDIDTTDSATITGRKRKTDRGIERKVEIFPLSEFEKSDKVSSPVLIQSGPKSTESFDLVEIVLSDKRYLVSPWSIRNGMYVQGLDSRFIVNKLLLKKKNL